MDFLRSVKENTVLNSGKPFQKFSITFQSPRLLKKKFFVCTEDSLLNLNKLKILNVSKDHKKFRKRGYYVTFSGVTRKLIYKDGSVMRGESVLYLGKTWLLSFWKEMILILYVEHIKLSKKDMSSLQKDSL